MKMKEKKLLIYNLILFYTLLIVEVSVILVSRLNKFQTGKVVSSFKTQTLDILSVIWPNLLFFILALIIIYGLFAWLNYKISLSIYYNFIKKRGQKESLLLLFLSFILINASFILIVYIFNSFLYPFSKQALFEPSYYSNSTIRYVRILFYLFVAGYLSLVFISLKRNAPFIRGSFVVLLIVIALFNYLPHFLAHSPLATSNNKGPNVIIIGIDSLRYDHLNSNGYPENLTPNIDGFLKNAIVFDNAYTPLARTYPSWMSILTGLYPPHSGVRYNLIKRSYLNHNLLTFNKILRNNNGYYCVHAMDETRFCNILFEDGFDELIHPTTGIVDFLFGEFHDFSLLNVFFNNRFGALLFPHIARNRAVAHLYKGDQFVDDVLLCLNNLMTKEKFFLAVHLCMPHWPFISGELPLLRVSNGGSVYERYCEVLKKADRQFEAIIEGIRKRNLYNNSIIIVLSDHGESFYEYWGHGTDLHDDAQNHIVLAIKPPNFTGHQIVSRLASTVDIFPTIFQMLDLPLPSQPIDGRSLLSDEGYKDKVVFMETGFHLFHPNGRGFTLDEMIEQGLAFYEVSEKTGLITVRSRFHQKILDSKQLGILSDRWKMILQPWRNGEYRVALYDRKDDPLCQTDIAERKPDVVFELQKELNAYARIGQVSPHRLAYKK